MRKVSAFLIAVVMLSHPFAKDWRFTWLPQIDIDEDIMWIALGLGMAGFIALAVGLEFSTRGRAL